VLLNETPESFSNVEARRATNEDLVVEHVDTDPERVALALPHGAGEATVTGAPLGHAVTVAEGALGAPTCG